MSASKLGLRLGRLLAPRGWGPQRPADGTCPDCQFQLRSASRARISSMAPAATSPSLHSLAKCQLVGDGEGAENPSQLHFHHTSKFLDLPGSSCQHDLCRLNAQPSERQRIPSSAPCILPLICRSPDSETPMAKSCGSPCQPFYRPMDGGGCGSLQIAIGMPCETSAPKNPVGQSNLSAPLGL